jgi:signal peptidase I
LVAKKKLAIIISVILLVSLSSTGALYFGTNIIRPFASPPNTIVLKFISTSMEPAIHEGNYILVDKNIDLELKTSYPNSDIIVFKNPTNPHMTYLASRIVSMEKINGTLYFQTKADSNGQKWPAMPSPSDYDSNTIWHTGIGVSQDLVIGKVVNANYK